MFLNQFLTVDKLKELFNSDLGVLAQVKSDLGAMLDVWEAYPKKDVEEKMREALQKVKEKLSRVKGVPESWFKKFNSVSVGKATRLGPGMKKHRKHL